MPVATRQLRTSAPLRRDQLPSLRLTAIGGPARGLTRLFQQEHVLVGRAGDADFSVMDDTVSQYHVELRVVEGGVLVTDHRSLNGVRLGDLCIERGVLPAGAEVHLGETVVRVEFAEAYTPATLTVSSYGGLVGRSPVMRQLYERIERVAGTRLSILLSGETGTGKEVVARTLHERGLRAGRPFVVLDCPSIPSTLAEAVLFGQRAGAFTDARDGRGAFERADGGVLFVDEVHLLPREVQAKLLGVLQRREIFRLGEERPRPVDIQILTGTTQDLRGMVNRGEFGEDLFQRLVQFEVRVPPLRERIEDVPLLVAHFLSKHEKEVVGRAMTQEVLKRLQGRAYPGNVRELENLVFAAAAIARTAMITVEDLNQLPPSTSYRTPLDEIFPPGTPGGIREARARFERAYLRRLMAWAGGNITAAAREADLQRKHLRSLLKDLHPEGTDREGTEQAEP